MKPTALERWWWKVDVDWSTGCWNWIGYIDPAGYGRFSEGRRNFRAHRWGYITLVGPIEDDLVLDHLCRNTRCVNPSHLDPVTQAVNMERGAQATATHCKRGHEFTPENTCVLPKQKRACRACTYERIDAYRKRKREAA